MADGTCDADGDVIVAGREPRGGSRRPGGLVWLLIVAQTAALAFAVSVAAHYRAEAAGIHRGGPPVVSLSAPTMPEVASVALRLLAGGGAAGTGVITPPARPGSAPAHL